MKEEEDKEDTCEIWLFGLIVQYQISILTIHSTERKKRRRDAKMCHSPKDIKPPVSPSELPKVILC